RGIRLLVPERVKEFVCSLTKGESPLTHGCGSIDAPADQVDSNPINGSLFGNSGNDLPPWKTPLTPSERLLADELTFDVLYCAVSLRLEYLLSVATRHYTHWKVLVTNQVDPIGPFNPK